MLNELQRHCLQHMGITVWQRRSDQRYLVIINEQSQATDALLQKMIAALKWPEAETQVRLNTAVHAWVEYEKILICGPLPEGWHPHTGQIVATVPALGVLLKDVEAKKSAWRAMQKLL